jgi:hypothetical protein
LGERGAFEFGKLNPRERAAPLGRTAQVLLVSAGFELAPFSIRDSSSDQILHSETIGGVPLKAIRLLANTGLRNGFIHSQITMFVACLGSFLFQVGR